MVSQIIARARRRIYAPRKYSFGTNVGCVYSRLYDYVFPLDKLRIFSRAYRVKANPYSKTCAYLIRVGKGRCAPCRPARFCRAVFLEIVIASVRHAVCSLVADFRRFAGPIDALSNEIFLLQVLYVYDHAQPIKFTVFNTQYTGWDSFKQTFPVVITGVRRFATLIAMTMSYPTKESQPSSLPCVAHYSHNCCQQ